MPELRKDPVIGRWVIIATERARRPGNFIDPEDNYFDDDEKDCPFCRGHEKAIYTVKNKNGKGWQVKVVPSGSPILNPKMTFEKSNQGLYFTIDAHGVHEVVIETPEHIANMADLDVRQIERVVGVYVERFKALETQGKLQYIIAYKNYGWEAGARRIGHSRSQIIASPVNPLRVKEKLTGAKGYYDRHERCLYCDLIKQEQQDDRRVILNHPDFMAVTPYAPRFPFEIWIIPKTHSCDFHVGVAGREGGLAAMLKALLQKIRKGLGDPAYNLIIHTAPFHKEQRWDRWRTIEQDYHWHIEVIPRLTRPAGFEKGTGFYICPIPPEETAAFLREVKIDG